MNRIQCWVPALFCGFLSLITLGSVLFAPSSAALAPVFLCFLPMCFFFVGSAIRNMQREIRELRAQLSAQAGAKP
jgi:TRAP-type C4-dicarboxylate transport system permease small subunit